MLNDRINPTAESRNHQAQSDQDSFLDAATGVFTDSDYSRVKVEHVVSHAGLSTPSFYNVFSGKSAWGAALLDRRLQEALDKQPAAGTAPLPAPRDRVLGNFALLGEVAKPLPGITKALADERTDSQMQYSDLIPRYYSEVVVAFQDCQEQRVFRADMEAAEMADFVIDSLAMAYAVHLDNAAAYTANLPSMILDGLSART